MCGWVGRGGHNIKVHCPVSKWKQMFQWPADHERKAGKRVARKKKVKKKTTTGSKDEMMATKIQPNGRPKPKGPGNQRRQRPVPLTRECGGSWAARLVDNLVTLLQRSWQVALLPGFWLTTSMRMRMSISIAGAFSPPVLVRLVVVRPSFPAPFPAPFPSLLASRLVAPALSTCRSRLLDEKQAWIDPFRMATRWRPSFVLFLLLCSCSCCSSRGGSSGGGGSRLTWPRPKRSVTAPPGPGIAVAGLHTSPGDQSERHSPPVPASRQPVLAPVVQPTADYSARFCSWARHDLPLDSSWDSFRFFQSFNSTHPCQTNQHLKSSHSKSLIGSLHDSFDISKSMAAPNSKKKTRNQLDPWEKGKNQNNNNKKTTTKKGNRSRLGAHPIPTLVQDVGYCGLVLKTTRCFGWRVKKGGNVRQN